VLLQVLLGQVLQVPGKKMRIYQTEHYKNR
jgi:hypothetical protein